jgi:hypothetical protein
MKDEFGLHIVIEHGKTQHHQHLYKDGGFYIEEHGDKFVLFDCGEYGDRINEEGVYDTLEEAFKIGNSWT